MVEIEPIKEEVRNSNLFCEMAVALPDTTFSVTCVKINGETQSNCQLDPYVSCGIVEHRTARSEKLHGNKMMKRINKNFLAMRQLSTVVSKTKTPKTKTRRPKTYENEDLRKRRPFHFFAGNEII